MDMKEEIFKKAGNVSAIQTNYDENGNPEWWLELETEIMDEGVEWNIYFRNQNGRKDLYINNNNYDVTELKTYKDENREEDKYIVEEVTNEPEGVLEGFITEKEAKEFIKNYNLKEVIDDIIDDVDELYTKLENEDEAHDFLEGLNSIISQAHNELDYDNGLSQTTLDELEIAVAESKDIRNKIELGSDIDTSIRFSVERAENLLQNS